MLKERFQMTLWDCIKFREVFYNLLSQDLKLKYRRTILGYFWSVLNPLLQLTVLSIIFSHVVRIKMEDYTLYLFSGLLAWTFFQTSLTISARCLIDYEAFIKKIYIPKLIFPLNKISLRAIDFAFSILALTLLGLVFGFPIRPTILLVPLAFIPLFLFTLGLCTLVSILTVFIRDAEYLLNVFLQLLYFATPILYPIETLPEKYRFWLSLNPIYPQIELFQALIYFGKFPSLEQWMLALGSALLFLSLGIGLLMYQEDKIVYQM